MVQFLTTMISMILCDSVYSFYMWFLIQINTFVNLWMNDVHIIIPPF